MNLEQLCVNYIDMYVLFITFKDIQIHVFLEHVECPHKERGGGGLRGIRGRCSLTAGGYTHIPCSNQRELHLVNVNHCFFSIHFIVFY